MTLRFKFWAVLIILLLPACEKNDDKASDSVLAPIEKNQTIDRGEALASVDGHNIYQDDLDSVLSNLFGEYRASQMDKTSRQRALESLVASYALSQQAQSNLSTEKLNEIKIKTERYRENLLINSYIRSKMEVGGLSYQEVKDYYQNNLEKFGQKKVKQYQLLTTAKPLPEELREKFMNIVSESRVTGDLTDIEASLNKSGFTVKQVGAELDEKLLDKKLFEFINSLQLEKLSPLYFIEGKPYLVKVINEKVIKAKPLEKVADTIKKSLALQKIKQAIKVETEQVLAQSKVIYSEN